MGILNVTPDSLSDGGRFYRSNSQNAKPDITAAVVYGMQLIREGAALLDIGGESTRPGSQPISLEEELERVCPVVEGLVQRTSIPISIDTTHARVAQAALQAGAHIINDISGGTFDPDMVDIVRRYDAGICLSHIQGIPRTMQDNPSYFDVVQEIKDWLRNRRDYFEAQGIPRSHICLDPGIGFGKTAAQNILLLRHLESFFELDCPVLVGHSRKRFIMEIYLKNRHFNSEEEEMKVRNEWTIRLTRALARSHVSILRVHDVSGNFSAVNE